MVKPYYIEKGVYRFMNQENSNIRIINDDTFKKNNTKTNCIDGATKTDCFLSIIVPVYNTEQYIKTCLDSLLNQDIDNKQYEIICVNDGSTDNSFLILQEYANKHKNILVIDKQNEGVSIARNIGLENAQGRYIWFFDADDWVARNCFGVIKHEIEINNPSILQLSFDWIKAKWRVDECEKAVLNKEKIKCSVHGISILDYVGAWSFIIKKDLLVRYRHKFVEHLHYGEDILFIRELLDCMRLEKNNIIYTIEHCEGDIFYYYRLHDESACRSSWTKHRKKYMDALLKLASIDLQQMNDVNKPKWYKQQYEDLFYMRMHNYMMDWLPGIDVDLKQYLKMLVQKNLYPCPKPPKRVFKKLTETKGGITSKIKITYKFYAFRWKWLYPMYYRQMRKKYLNVER